jgi:hypothetical protein
MKLRIASALLAVALLAGACGDQSPALATVNGETVTADFMASLRGSYQGSINVNTEEFRNDLSENIFRVAIAQEAESKFGITVTEEEIDDRLANPPLRWQGLFTAVAENEDTTEAYGRTQAQLSILRDEVVAELIRAEDGFIESVVNDSPQDLTAGCMRHILVGTEAEAVAAIERLNAGEEFVAVANELTIDTVSGGEPVGGCPVAFGGLTPSVAQAAVAAPLNDVVGPVQSEFGFHVILVEQRVDAPTMEELAADPVLYLPAEALSSFFRPWFNQAVRDAEISVAESVGRWSEAGIGIIPPGE